MHGSEIDRLAVVTGRIAIEYVPFGRDQYPEMRPLALLFRLHEHACRVDAVLGGHVRAFERLGGVPRVLLTDNLKSAVLERAGDAIRFHPTLLALAA